jgi:pilus assembly protein Flp/PilA
MREKFSLFVAKAYARMGELRREDGQALAEYALILALVSVASIVALTALGGSISGVLSNISGQISGAV